MAIGEVEMFSEGKSWEQREDEATWGGLTKAKNVWKDITLETILKYYLKTMCHGEISSMNSD